MNGEVYNITTALEDIEFLDQYQVNREPEAAHRALRRVDLHSRIGANL